MAAAVPVTPIGSAVPEAAERASTPGPAVKALPVTPVDAVTAPVELPGPVVPEPEELLPVAGVVFWLIEISCSRLLICTS